MAFYTDGTCVYGVTGLPLVGIPTDVIRFKLVERPTHFPVVYLKRKNGDFERWTVKYTDETRRAIMPNFCNGRNVMRVVFK